MASQETFWDLILARKDSQWMGFRVRGETLSRVSIFFGSIIIALCLCALSWILASWRLTREETLSASLRLEKLSLERRLGDLETHLSVQKTESPKSKVTEIPSLEDNDFESPLVKFNDTSLEFDSKASELSFKLNLSSPDARQATPKINWVLLLGNSQSVFSFPSAFAMRAGSLIAPEKGPLVDEFRGVKQISAKFKNDELFAKDRLTDPVWAFVYLYDVRGTMLARKKLKVSLLGAGK